MAQDRNQASKPFLRRNFYSSFRNSRRYQTTTSFIKKKPFTAFLISLGLLFFLIILASILSNLGKKATSPVKAVKTVNTYAIGSTPTVDLQARVETNGVVQIVAQAPGIVASVPAHEGDTVYKGQTIVNLSSNYQGGNAVDLQAQLASAQYQNIRDTYSTQKELLAGERNIANLTSENSEELRQISDKSRSDTRAILNNIRDQFNAVNAQVSFLEQNDPTNTTLTTLRQQQTQLQSTVAQIQNAYNSLEYQTDPTNPPTQLSNAQKDLSLKQLDIQEKALDLGREVSRIQYNLALVAQGTMHPASPFNGTIERINVHVGQSLNPGQAIATIACSNLNTTAVLNVPREIAQSISRIEPSIFHIDGQDVEVLPTYVSSVATDNQLYSIIFDLPTSVSSSLTDSEYIPVSIPVGFANTASIIPFIPIDSIYQSQSESTVFLFDKKKVISRKVDLGKVYGDYVEVKNGLHSGDQIILDRTVVAGDNVAIRK